jgi:hypothetical protein
MVYATRMHLSRTIASACSIAITLCCMMLILGMSRANAADISFSTVRECATSAVIKCGSLTTGQLIHDYDANTYAKKVYAYEGISATDIQNLSTTSYAGSVSKNGTIYIKGQTTAVASQATIATARIVKGATITYKSIRFSNQLPSSFFTTNAADAFVVMHNKIFAFAIIASSDDPVTGTSTVKATTSAIDSSVSFTTSSVTSQNPATLVNTGPFSNDTVLIPIVFITLGGSLGYYCYQLRRIRRSTKKPS